MLQWIVDYWFYIAANGHSKALDHIESKAARIYIILAVILEGKRSGLFKTE
jgi:hypothetical protein